MARTVSRQGQLKTFRAKVTGRHAITLPAELCRELGIENGDTVELTLHPLHAALRRVPDEPPLPLEGILAGDFADWDDINRFIREERNGIPDDVE